MQGGRCLTWTPDGDSSPGRNNRCSESRSKDVFEKARRLREQVWERSFCKTVYPSASPPISSNLPSFTCLYLTLQVYEPQLPPPTLHCSSLSVLSKHPIAHVLMYPLTSALPREQKCRSAGGTERRDKGRGLISSVQLLIGLECNYSSRPC